MFDGICFGGLGCLNIETHARLLAKTWHVSMGGRFQGLSFEAHVLWHGIFNQLKQALGYHQNTTCFCINLLWGQQCMCMEITLGRLKMSNTITTCHWNNIGASKNVFPKMASKLSKVKFSNNQTLLMNNYTPNAILNASFVALCAICTTMVSSTSSILISKNCHLRNHEGICCSWIEKTTNTLVINYTIYLW
jgi:hypothetical protein